jgi:hypothetical protein
MMLPPMGKALVINGRLHEVVVWSVGGWFDARDSITGVVGTYDYYTSDVIDPSKSPEAFLIALSKIER